MVRAIKSMPPPAASGTTSVIVLLGKVSARAGLFSAAIVKSTLATRRSVDHCIVVSSRSALEEPERLAAGAGLEAQFVFLVGNVDYVYRAVALAGNKQIVAMERHVHRLAADRYSSLFAERRIEQAYRVAVEAGDAKQAVIGCIAGDLRGLRHVLQHHLVADSAGIGIDQDQF